LFLVSDLDTTLWALVKEEEVFCQTDLTESVLASSGDRMGEIVFAERAEDGDATES